MKINTINPKKFAIYTNCAIKFVKYFSFTMLWACSNFTTEAQYPAFVEHLTKKMLLVPASSSTPAFYIDETPITYTDFDLYIQVGGSKTAFYDYPTYRQPDNPVTGITWYQAVDYCNWRSKRDGLKPAYFLDNQQDSYGYTLWELDDKANGYRLPSAEMFSYVASAGDTQKQYAWGDIFVDSLANYDQEKGFMRGKWWRLAKVKTDYKNAWGVYGMAGNIWHWCNENSDNQSVKGIAKKLKGGSWGSSNPIMLNVQSESYTAPSNYNYDIGFRCILPATAIAEVDMRLKDSLQHTFFRPQWLLSKRNEPLESKLADYIALNFPHCLYFWEKVDEQPQISPQILAKTIIQTAENHYINPVFLASIMASESGMASCSFPRWFNNPMAYHWQNGLMAQGSPTYVYQKNRNQKFKNLAEGMRYFCKGIRKKVYFLAAQKNLQAFQLVYVGYAAPQWIERVNKTYKEILGVDFQQDNPKKEAGKWIYTDWEELKKQYPLANSSNNAKKKYYIVLNKKFNTLAQAQQQILQLHQKGFTEADILTEKRDYWIFLAYSFDEKQATYLQQAMQKRLTLSLGCHIKVIEK